MFKAMLLDINQIPEWSPTWRCYDDEGVPVIETENECIALDDPVRTYPLERVIGDAVELTFEEFQAQFPQATQRLFARPEPLRQAA
jgi:hypothetical protein